MGGGGRGASIAEQRGRLLKTGVVTNSRNSGGQAENEDNHFSSFFVSHLRSRQNLRTQRPLVNVKAWTDLYIIQPNSVKRFLHSFLFVESSRTLWQILSILGGTWI